jgi:hypothetical protein
MSMHEGVRCYLHWKNGYTPIYSCFNDMPAETFLVYEYCLGTDRVKDSEPDLLEMHRAAEADFGRIGFFNMIDGSHPFSHMLPGNQ